MPQDKDIKRVVRARMAETGERYTQAKAAVESRSPSTQSDTVYQEWLDALGTNESRAAAYHSLKSLPDDVLRPLAVRRATHENWRIRRGCCRLLDDLVFTTESLEVLEGCLEDPDSRVRRAALHCLSCQHCKPEGCVVDSRSVLERMAERDPSDYVRHLAASAVPGAIAARTPRLQLRGPRVLGGGRATSGMCPWSAPPASAALVTDSSRDLMESGKRRVRGVDAAPGSVHQSFPLVGAV